MKILACTDMHGSLKAYKKIAERAKKAELVICCGDLTVFSQNLEYFLNRLNKLKKPCLLIPGNHENEDDIEMLCRAFKNLICIHGKMELMDNYLFIGHGGGGFSMMDKDFEKLSRKWEKKIKVLRKKKDLKVVFVCHMPPYKTKLDKIMDTYCGNKSYLSFIKRVKPDYVFCGHLHENNGKEDKLGNVRIINPGPMGKVLEI